MGLDQVSVILARNVKSSHGNGSWHHKSDLPHVKCLHSSFPKWHPGSRKASSVGHASMPVIGQPKRNHMGIRQT